MSTEPKPDLNTCDTRDTTLDTPLPVYYERLPVLCPSCKKPEPSWRDDDVHRGWRMHTKRGELMKEYHCMQAYYELQ